MSKIKSSQKKVSLSQLTDHEVNNKRQALKDLKKLNFDDLPANVFFITVPHDFINIIRISDGLIRATITDGDSLSIKEGLFYNKVVYATGVVDRPKEVLVFNNFDELQNLISNNITNGTHSDVKNNFDDILKVYLELQE